jgi:hemolysin activation/secretion protein
MVHGQQLPDPAAELRRQQERAQAQKQQIQGPSRDVAPQAPSPVPVPNEPRLPANESPCFAITHIDIREVPPSGGTSNVSNSYAWVGNALSGPAQDDTPIGKCVGCQTK